MSVFPAPTLFDYLQMQQYSLSPTASLLTPPTRIFQAHSVSLSAFSPFGDSITWGDQPDIPLNHKNSYRKPLYNLLICDDARVHFVGTQSLGNMTEDRNEGHRGWTIDELRHVIKPALAFKPSIILLHIGTNDLNKKRDIVLLYSEAPHRLGRLIDVILAERLPAVLFVVRLIHAKNNETDRKISEYKAAIPGLVKARQRKGVHVEVVDMSVVPTEELADLLHP